MQAYEKDQIIVITVAADQCATLGKLVETYLEQGKRAFVFDMGKATFLNSVNIATIIAARNKITASGGKAAVANLTDSIKAVFRILKLERLFDLNCSLDSALAQVR